MVWLTVGCVIKQRLAAALMLLVSATAINIFKWRRVIETSLLYVSKVIVPLKHIKIHRIPAYPMDFPCLSDQSGSKSWAPCLQSGQIKSSGRTSPS